MLPVSLDCPFLIALENTEGAIINGQSRETGNIGYTRYINVREYRKGNQKWTIQRNWQHRVHKINLWIAHF
jgi:hypothetical protein